MTPGCGRWSRRLPAAERQHRDAARQAETMARHRARLRDEISSLEEQQDDLLDRFYSDV